MNGKAPRLASRRGRRTMAAAGLFALLGAALIAMPGSAAAAVGPTDLSLTKTDSPDPVLVGSNLTYTIRVQNLGANDASAVTVTDALSASDVDFVSATASSGTCNKSGNTVSCDLGQVNAGTTATVTIVVKTKKTGIISNTASVASPEDTNTANNQATATTTVTATPKKNKASCATPTISGTPGNDVLVGTGGADVIRGFSGDDQIFGGAGRDLICADLGGDFVVGGGGGDTVIGGAGLDRLIGGLGPDLLKGKAGRDKLRGQAGGDTLNGGRGRDSCKGGAGRDVLRRCP
jgi:uncharacterized repeat protein (TIGR01451 family)